MALPENALPHSPKTPVLETAGSALPPSPWLYLSGWFVTLSGLYAVCYELESSGYRLAVYIMATLGYLFSYGCRRAKISIRSLQTPALLLLAAGIVVAASTNHGFDILLPAEALTDRAKALQMLIAWGAIFQVYTLTSDPAVLFACVPSMTMIALVSTIATTDPVMQNIFLVFVGSATFLMVHENYLRTRLFTHQSGPRRPDHRLLGGQVQLALLCVFSALLLAKIAVVPIRLVGQTLFVPAAMSSLNNAANRNGKIISANAMMERSDAVDLANGPVNASDQILMTVTANQGHYWRGTTFDRYNGNSFTNAFREFGEVSQEAASAKAAPPGYFHKLPMEPDSKAPAHVYNVPTARVELPDEEMGHSKICEQTVHLISGMFSQIYGAEKIEQVSLPEGVPHWNRAGNLTTSVVLPAGTQYHVRSRVPDSSVAHLRAASSSLEDVPYSIQRHYLQLPKESLWLREQADQITAGCTNNYDKALAIQEYIAQNCRYNLQTPRAPRDGDVVEYFLRNSKMGYCDSFGAAMTILCRYAGIPARMASGFITGDLMDGVYVLREKHRHIWTEVFFPGIGWVPFDATEGAEDISDYPNDGKHGINFFKWLVNGGFMPALLSSLCVGLVGYVIRNEWQARYGAKTGRRKPTRLNRAETNLEIAGTYESVCRAFKRRRLTRSPAMTPEEFARWLRPQLAQELPEILAPLQTLTTLYERARYGAEEAAQEDVVQAKAAAAQIVQQLRQYRRNKAVTAPRKEAG